MGMVEGNIASYPEIWVNHLRDSATGEFIFVTLVFEDFSRLGQGSYENPINTSIIDYPNYQAGGIVNIMQLPMDGSADTTHQFIELPIYITMPGIGNVFVGTALFYNMNYVAPAMAE